ncbi:MAG TPA: SRPBCC family protein [Candidatus Binatus sp.]|nr:SRPBCC family protein [Candidatus Binatus sp.]
MRVHTLERVQVVRRPLAETFRFFTDPRNLKRLTPEHLNFKFLEPPPSELHVGSTVDYQIRLYGVPVHWRTRIEFVDAPKKFVDVQEKGPYALWRHRHLFRDVGHGRTEIKDQLEYVLPLWPVGEVAYYLFVDRALREIFDFRETELAAIIAAESRSAATG